MIGIIKSSKITDGGTDIWRTVINASRPFGAVRTSKPTPSSISARTSRISTSSSTMSTEGRVIEYPTTLRNVSIRLTAPRFEPNELLGTGALGCWLDRQANHKGRASLG